MNRFSIPQENEALDAQDSQLVKATSLQYLKEALADEAYEECAELIAIAKESGAFDDEVRQVIAAHVRFVQERARINNGRFRRP